MSDKDITAQSNEIVTRFVNNRHKINKAHNVLKYTVFQDNRSPREVSVFQIKDLLENNKENEIWDLANEHIFKNTPSRVKGRADLKVEDIRQIRVDSESLEVFIDGKPIWRHGNIRYIPSSREIEMKTAQNLASIAVHHLI